MAYIGSQTNGINTYHEEIIPIIGNIGIGNDTLLLSIDTTNIVNIDLLELRFRPDASEVVASDLDILDILWKNTNLKTNAGEHYVSVFATRNNDGVYHYEPNHPPNLLFQENSLHTHLPKRYSLEIKKRSTGTRLQTQSFLLRVKVTKFLSKSLVFHANMESVILNQ